MKGTAPQSGELCEYFMIPKFLFENKSEKESQNPCLPFGETNKGKAQYAESMTFSIIYTVAALWDIIIIFIYNGSNIAFKYIYNGFHMMYHFEDAHNGCYIAFL